MATPISRRRLLRATGTTSLALLLAACADGSDPATDDASPDDGADDQALPSGEEIGAQAIAAAGLEGTATLAPIVATFEVLTGPTGRIPFGLLDDEQQPLLDRDVQVWVVKDGELVAGPIDPVFFGEGLGPRGIYVAPVELTEGGLYDAVIQVDGDRIGVAPFPVRTPEDSSSFPPGATFPVLATPTVDEPGGLDRLCTRSPACTMHDVSLDTVLGQRPVVFTVSTPAFCQTAVCGPVVDVVEDVKGDAAEGVAFVHAEVYSDAGITPSPVVNQLELPSEPWTWVIGADGVVVDRFDGPVVPSLLQDALDRA